MCTPNSFYYQCCAMSTRRTFTDSSGESLTVECYEDCYFSRAEFPIPFEEHMRKVRQMDIRDDDVLLFTYPKSGTHWLWEVVAMLANEDLEYREGIRGMDMFEWSAVESLDTTPSPRVIAGHFLFRFMPKDVFKKKPKMIYVIRHPKSVAVSFYNMTVGMKGADRYDKIVPIKPYSGTFEDYLELFLNGEVPYGSWCQHVVEFEQWQHEHSDIPILVIHFEDMKQNAVACIKRISEFLGKPCDDVRAKDVAEACSFAKMKQVNAGTKAGGIEWRGKDGTIFRKGSNTDWKDWFTVAQNERFDRVLKKKVPGSRLLHHYID